MTAIVSGKRIPFTQDWWYMVSHHSGRKFSFQSTQQLSAEELLYVQNSTDEALDGYIDDGLELSHEEKRRR
jgi:hypothetical protein